MNWSHPLTVAGFSALVAVVSTLLVDAFVRPQLTDRHQQKIRRQRILEIAKAEIARKDDDEQYADVRCNPYKQEIEDLTHKRHFYKKDEPIVHRLLDFAVMEDWPPYGFSSRDAAQAALN